MAQATIDAEFASARAELYELLSRVLDGEVSVLMEAIESGAFTSFAGVFPVDFETDPLTRDDLDQEALEIGYDNLFEVPGPYYVPPFASGHATDPSETFDSDARYHDEGTAGELLGDPAESVAALYERTDFAPERGGGIPDHVAAELEFMSRLAAQRARSGSIDTEALQTVEAELLEHLEWIDTFADQVAETDQAEGVYAAVCAFTNAFVQWDRAQMSAVTV